MINSHHKMQFLGKKDGLSTAYFWLVLADYEIETVRR